MTTLRLFGHPALEHKGARRPANLPPKAIAAVALIIANAPRPLSRDRIAQALWPGIDPPQARANLRRQLYVAAKTLGRDALLIDRETVQWNPSCALQVDALHFDAHHASDPESAAQQYLGELCEGVDDPALDEIRAGYARRYESLLAQATARARESGDRDALARCLQRALQQDPLDEEIARELMRLRCASGDRASALRIYNQLSRDLQRELGTLPSEDTGAALDQVLSADASSAIRTNIVAPQTSLVAREQEVETVHALLTQHCLVSIIGPGGIGKTRLAIAAALSAAQLYPDGVWFVELAGVKDRHAILERMSAAAGARCGSGEPEEALAEALHRKRVLLVIDNCEHVRSDVSKICGVLADRTAARMLVTSRSKLAAEFEAAYDLGGLAIPPLQMRSADAVRRYGAVRLFMERVCAVAPHVRLNDANAQVIAEIVSRLDGIPLAIELIAARGGMLTLEALHKRITSNLSIVTRAGAARGATERHATMERALRWSYELLGTAEQALFRRLYVFAGPWDADACHGVCVEGSSTLNEISNYLSQLADASLLRRRIVNDTVHYTMLQPIRQFSESLGADERETLIRKHAEYYIAFAGRHDAPMETHGDDYLRAMVGAEENLFFALRTACAAEDFAGAATLLITASPYWGRSAQYGRIAQSMSLLLEESRLQRFDAEIRAQLFRAAGRFAFGRGEWTEAIRLDLLAARTFEEIGKPYNALMARLAANVAGANTGTPIEERIEEHKNILARHMELGVGPPWVAGELQSDLSAMYKTLGQTQTALDYALSALELLRLHGRRGREAMLLTIVTRIYCELGATGKAQECAHEAIRILGDIGEEATLGEAYRNLALAQMAAGLPESEVFTTLLAALSLHSRRQEARFTLFAVDACLEAFLKYGYVRQAARAVGHVLSLRERTNYNRPGDLFPSAAVCSATQQAVGADYSTLVGLGRLDSLVELQEELRRLVSGSPREEPDKETIAS